MTAPLYISKYIILEAQNLNRNVTFPHNTWCFSIQEELKKKHMHTFEHSNIL